MCLRAKKFTKEQMVTTQTLRLAARAFLLCHLFVFRSGAQQPASKAGQQPYSFSLTAKLHSTGHSIYSGQYLNHHPNAEINLSYKYKRFGAFITKSTDVADLQSSINFTTIGLSQSFKVGRSLTVMPYVGLFLRQSHGFADDASDAWSCVVVKYRLTSFFILENTILVSNLIRHRSKVSLANRFNVTVAIGKIKFDAYAWYCHAKRSKSHFISTSVAITSPDWIISPSISARLQVAVLHQMASEKPEGSMRRGALVSLIVPVNLSKNSVTK
jgi:hypothetical protein